MRDILKKITPDVRRRAITVMGVAGLLLIFLSSFIHTDDSSQKQNAPPEEETAQLSQSDYRKELEQELSEMISLIEGAGSVRVLITMDTTAEDIYAVDKTTAGTSSESGQTSSENSEYVIIKAKDGSEQVVLKKQKMPEIRGVLVVCSGGGSSVVREKVTTAVAGALGISRGKVVVTN